MLLAYMGELRATQKSNTFQLLVHALSVEPESMFVS